MAEGEWQTATASRRRRNGKTAACLRQPGNGPSLSSRCDIGSQMPTERQVQQSCTLVDDAARDLAASPFWQHLRAQLAQLPPHCALAGLRHLVIYGLGSLQQPGAVHIRYQLAAARLLAALLPLAAPAEAFDPVFTSLDRAVLAHNQIEVTPTDEQGRRVAAVPTLFFMPHCEAVLTDALLAANVAAGTLHNVVILGNRFSGYHDQSLLRPGGKRPITMEQPQPQQAQQHGGDACQGQDGGMTQGGIMLRLRSCGVVQERRVDECGFSVLSAFNDLGLHCFELKWQRRLDCN